MFECGKTQIQSSKEAILAEYESNSPEDRKRQILPAEIESNVLEVRKRGQGKTANV